MSWFSVASQFFRHKIIDAHEEDAIVIVVATHVVTYDDDSLETIVQATERVGLLVYLFLWRQTEGGLDVATATAFVAYEIHF